MPSALKSSVKSSSARLLFRYTGNVTWWWWWGGGGTDGRGTQYWAYILTNLVLGPFTSSLDYVRMYIYML